MISSCYRHCGPTHDRHDPTMDKEEELLKILGKLRGGSLEEVTDKLLAFFRELAWWEEEFDAQFVARGSRRAEFISICDRNARGRSTWRTRRSTSLGGGSTRSRAV